MSSKEFEKFSKVFEKIKDDINIACNIVFIDETIHSMNDTRELWNMYVKEYSIVHKWFETDYEYSPNNYEIVIFFPMLNIHIMFKGTSDSYDEDVVNEYYEVTLETKIVKSFVTKEE